MAQADPLVLARAVAEQLDDEAADTIVHDDEHGIYGHPDHVAAHRIGALAAELAGVTAYRTTIDREHLRVSARDRHLVHGAARAAATPYGRATVEIDLAVTGNAAQLDVKRAAIVAHESQLAPEDVPADGFAAAYGYEWYRRSGPPGVLDQLGNAHLVAAPATPVPASQRAGLAAVRLQYGHPAVTERGRTTTDHGRPTPRT